MSTPILIIGTGIAGLSAASFLRETGVDCILLEARDRVGGRIHSVPAGERWFEAGASWIHGPKKNPLMALAEAAGAVTVYDDPDELRLYDAAGNERAEKSVRKSERRLNKALRKLEGLPNESLESGLIRQFPEEMNGPLWRWMISSYLEFDLGGDARAVSALHFRDDDEFSGGDLLITNGYTRIPDFLAEELDIRLNTIVTGIKYGASGVEVQTATGEIFSADRVIVTIPLGVLQSGDVTFTPALPESHTRAVNQLAMGTVNKVYLRWAEPFWDKEQPYFGITTTDRGLFNYFLNNHPVTGEAVLITYAFGEAAPQSEEMTDNEVVALIMTNLRTVFGTDAPVPESILRSRWKGDPYARGSYSFTPAGGDSAAYLTLGEPVADRLFFAGEHTSFDFRGTVHGAMFSGVEAAGQLLERTAKSPVNNTGRPTD